MLVLRPWNLCPHYTHDDLRPLSLSSYHRFVRFALSCANENTAQQNISSSPHIRISGGVLTFSLCPVESLSKRLRRVPCGSCAS
jgi:hypothetical protein